MSDTIQVTKTIAASPEQAFAVLADPTKHADIDGDAMLRGLDGDATITGVGDQFIMKMNNDELGDYKMRNTITAFEPGRKIGWAPELYPLDGYQDKLGDAKATGHTYTWDLEPAADGGTQVTHTYDWSGATDPEFRKLLPLLDEKHLTESVERLGRLAQ